MFRFLEIGEVITEDTCTTVFTSCQGGDVVPSAIKKVKSENESSDSFCLLMKFFFRTMFCHPSRLAVMLNVSELLKFGIANDSISGH